MDQCTRQLKNSLRLADKITLPKLYTPNQYYIYIYIYLKLNSKT